MKWILILSFAAVSAWARADESCECQKLACDACSVEQGVKFYTTKCGPGDSRTKSCARPTCLPIDEATAECPNPPPKGDKTAREPIVVGSVATVDAKDDTRIVGEVKVLQGSATLVDTSGHRTAMKAGTKVRESDSIETGKDGRVLVTFDGGNKLHVQTDTSVQIKEYKDASDASTRRALLQLIKGRIRNQVEQKYNGKSSYYQVRTRAAVAGVRGTDFVVEETEGKDLQMRVETLRGRVQLMSLDQHAKQDILRGEGATYTVSASADEFVQSGKMSPIYKLSEEKLHELDLDTRADLARVNRPVQRATSPSDPEICKGPAGHFNECAWQCRGNPKKEKICRTDLEHVSCVRTRCNANGVWADETTVPAADAQGLCPAKGALVKVCDY